MADPILIGEVVVPGKALQVKAVRSGGPGGQNVNKVASKVELRVNLDLIEGLNDSARARLQARIQNQLDADGLWIVVSSKTRDQILNLEDARNKVATIIGQILVPPKHRTPTRPTRSSQIRRVETKKRTAKIKQGRGKADWD